jgi:hypothetical protein
MATDTNETFHVHWQTASQSGETEFKPGDSMQDAFTKTQKDLSTWLGDFRDHSDDDCLSASFSTNPLDFYLFLADKREEGAQILNARSSAAVSTVPSSTK